MGSPASGGYRTAALARETALESVQETALARHISSAWARWKHICGLIQVSVLADTCTNPGVSPGRTAGYVEAHVRKYILQIDRCARAKAAETNSTSIHRHDNFPAWARELSRY